MSMILPRFNPAYYYAHYNSAEGISYDEIETNGEKLAVFHKKLPKKLKYVTLDLSEHTVILMSPLKARCKVTIKAQSIISLAKIKVEYGALELNAKCRVIVMKRVRSEEIILKAPVIFFPEKFNEQIKRNAKEISNLFHFGVQNEKPKYILMGLVKALDDCEKEQKKDDSLSKMLREFHKFLEERTVSLSGSMSESSSECNIRQLELQ